MQIGWVDFSKTERDKVVSILRLLGTQTALDELGIGTVRDAFSDMFFPGISTLQTRAKYFVILPYLFAQAENHRFKPVSYTHLTLPTICGLGDVYKRQGIWDRRKPQHGKDGEDEAKFHLLEWIADSRYPSISKHFSG